MSNDNAGRTSRTTAGNGPMGSAVALVITAVALVLGFLILRKMNDEPSSSSGGNGGGTEQTTTTALDPNATTSSVGVTTTTVPPLVTTGTKVQVANCSTVDGAAGKLTTALSGTGFLMAEAANCSPTQAKLTATEIVYDPAVAEAQAVAESLGRLLGGGVPTAKANPVANADGVYPEGTGVLVLVGSDIAGKTLDEIAGKPTTGTTAAPTSSTTA